MTLRCAGRAYNVINHAGVQSYNMILRVKYVKYCNDNNNYYYHYHHREFRMQRSPNLRRVDECAKNKITRSVRYLSQYEVYLNTAVAV